MTHPKVKDYQHHCWTISARLRVHAHANVLAPRLPLALTRLEYLLASGAGKIFIHYSLYRHHIHHLAGIETA